MNIFSRYFKKNSKSESSEPSFTKNITNRRWLDKPVTAKEAKFLDLYLQSEGGMTAKKISAKVGLSKKYPRRADVGTIALRWLHQNKDVFK